MTFTSPNRGVEVGAYSEETHQLLGVMNMNKWTYRIYQGCFKKKRIEYCHRILRRNMACGYTIPYTSMNTHNTPYMQKAKINIQEL